MRRIILTAIAALGLSVGGCDRDSDGDRAPSVRPARPWSSRKRASTPCRRKSRRWRARNGARRQTTTRARSPAICASASQGRRGGPVVFAFATGVTVAAQPYNVVPADSRSGVGGQSFAAVLGGDPRVNAYLYRVHRRERDASSAAQGGLCGESGDALSGGQRVRRWQRALGVQDRGVPRRCAAAVERTIRNSATPIRLHGAVT